MLSLASGPLLPRLKRTRTAVEIGIVFLVDMAVVLWHQVFGQSQWIEIVDGNYQIVGEAAEGMVAFAVPYKSGLLENARPQSEKSALLFSVEVTPVTRTTRVKTRNLPQSPDAVKLGSTNVMTRQLPPRPLRSFHTLATHQSSSGVVESCVKMRAQFNGKPPCPGQAFLVVGGFDSVDPIALEQDVQRIRIVPH